MIRQATHDDIYYILYILYNINIESKVYSKYTLNYTKIYNILYNYISNNNTVIFVSENEDKEIEGIFMGGYKSPWFSDDTVANDTLMYVLSEHRGRGASKRLLESFLGWCKERSVSRIVLGETMQINGNAIEMYKKIGFEPLGSSVVRYE